MTKTVIEPYLEKFIAKKLEGGLFAHIYMHNFSGKHFVSRDLYTVKDGKVYDVTQKNGLYATGDTCFDVDKDCKRIGKYDPNKTYKRTTNSFKYSDIKKLLKL